MTEQAPSPVTTEEQPQPPPVSERDLTKPPYPFCMGNPTIADCARAGYCRRDPACDD